MRLKEVMKMAYNIPNNYQDLTPAEQLDKKTLNKMVWRSVFLQASFNFERMQSAGWLYGILPGLVKIHKNKDDLAASMSHNLEFFNTHPFLVNLVMGIILSMEQSKSDIPTIRAVRVAAMGPLGGIGDALFWFTLVPVAAGITSNMAINGSVVAPFLFLLIFNGVQFAVRYVLMHWSYKMGTNAIGALTANAKEFTRAASILGIFIVGSLTSLFGGGTVVDILIPNGEAVIDIQAILDGILPTMIPLGLTLFMYLLMSKHKWTPLRCIFLILMIGLVGSGLGIWPSIWPPV